MALLGSGRALISRARLLILGSLALTWYLAFLAPPYQHAVQIEVSSRISKARRRLVGLPSEFNSSKVAMLIEPRPLPQLVPLTMHMVAVVPPDWSFLFIGSPWSVYNVGRSPAVRHQQALGKMTLATLPKPWAMQTREDVYRLLTDMRFYDEFLPGVEWVFKYDHDCILCANSPWSLDDWLDWSWAGAARSDKDEFPGAGGLTLRRVSAVRRVLGFQSRLNDSEPEDEWFGKRLSAMPGEKVAAEPRSPFAVRDMLTERPMGYQVQADGPSIEASVWKRRDVRRKTLEYCPELSMLMDMKLERERCPDDDMEGGRTGQQVWTAVERVGKPRQQATAAEGRRGV
ncbi:hypothetical protein L249_6618 [Ophiocordyceps polyrhachis-furcata BCC 54312]|uniref:DUF5672 domain-containing protein n=1 Tax=Ophiocordyceps polyrhachis-furcata BCC 54312 TaxID=1330021 RepID=A0A367LL04_9HYPO|nr:hypothetical protein L249_6618 [Ophiocordyceps polyrhachis-furcata BCC 54312]